MTWPESNSPWLLPRCDKRDGTDMACAGSTGSGNPAEAGAKDAFMIVDEAETQHVAETNTETNERR